MYNMRRVAESDLHKIDVNNFFCRIPAIVGVVCLEAELLKYETILIA